MRLLSQIREDTDVLRPATALQSDAFDIREDTEVLGKTATLGGNHTGVMSAYDGTESLRRNTQTSAAAFGVREDTEVLNRTANITATGIFNALTMLTFSEGATM
jgi:hypothetical protein